MTNLNDTEAELGLAFGINNEWKTSNTGAGANAISKADMMSLAGRNSLAELVWSSQTGLGIKFAEKEPSFLSNVGSSDVRFLHSEDTRDEKHISEYHSVAALATSHVSAEVKSSGSVEIAGSTCNVHTSPQNEGTTDPDKLSKCLFEATDQCGSQEQLESGNHGLDDGEMEKLVIFKNKNITERGDLLPREDNNNEHEVESHGIIESCRSANLLTLVNKRKSRIERQLIFKSKRIKKLGDECTVRKDSSFMSWISNLKGLENHEIYDKKIGIREETISFQRTKTGFQNVFRSLYSQDSRAHETIARMPNNSICSLKERVITTKEIKEKEADGVEKRIRLYERISIEAPKEMFDTIRRLRLSRTDILK